MATITIIKGDLLETELDIIVQQCNCITITALGLAQAIKIKLQVDPYGHRKAIKGKKNCAQESDRGNPGTITIHKSPTTGQTVVCLYAQYSPGKPGIYHQSEVQKNNIQDTSEQRLHWFKECLKLLKQYLDTLLETPESNSRKKNKIRIGLPYLIGCGLAGGNWQEYKTALDEWTTTLDPNQVEILLVHKE